MAETNETPEISLVIPAYNEQEVIPELLRRVEAALRLAGQTFEVVIVDDGSTDHTPQMLREAMRDRPWLRVVRMSRNGGQSAAFDAGFKAARAGRSSPPSTPICKTIPRKSPASCPCWTATT